MKMSECIKRDNLLVAYLLEHKGVENAVSRHEIARFIRSKGYPQSPDTVHGIIQRLLRERHLPICSLNRKGYFWAKSKSDILGCISSLNSRINALQEHIDNLKYFIIE